MPSPLLYSVREAATLLSLSHWTIRGYIRDGVLPYVRIGRRTLIEDATLRDLIARGRVDERE